METMVIYIIKVSAALLVFYLFYLLVFSQSTFYRFNRYYLIMSVILSFIFPLMHMTFGNDLTGAGMTRVLQGVSVYANRAAQSSFAEKTMVIPISGMVYFLVFTVFITRLMSNVLRITLLKRKSTAVYIEGIRVYLVKSPVSSFSFGKWIFFDEKMYPETEKFLVLKHELAHVNQYHTLDVLLFEILCSLLWFYPVTWMYKRSLRQVHEFLADDAVLKNGYEPVDYMHLLYNQVVNIYPLTLSNYFNQSLIKRRFIMINKARSGRISAFLTAISIPLIILTSFVLVNSIDFPAFAQKGEKVFAKVKLQDKNNPSSKDKKGEKVFKKIDQMAEYPGGIEALQQYISKEIKYPELAKTWGINLKVYINFVISSDGTLDLIKIIKSTPSYADNHAKKASEDVFKKAVNEMELEAVRVVGAAPGVWTPAKSEGKNVASQYTIPINFKLK